MRRRGCCCCATISVTGIASPGAAVRPSSASGDSARLVGPDGGRRMPASVGLEALGAAPRCAPRRSPRDSPSSDHFPSPPGVRVLACCADLSGLHRVELCGLFCAHHPDRDEIERADEAVRDAEAACAGNRVAERHCPLVLEQDQRRGAVVRDLLDDVPGVLLRERMDAVGSRFCARCRADLCALFALEAEADERADLRAELAGLVLRQGAEVLDLEPSPSVLVDGERVEDANRVALAKTLELCDHLAVEVRVLKAEHDELHWPYSHEVPPICICGQCPAGGLTWASPRRDDSTSLRRRRAAANRRPPVRRRDAGFTCRESSASVRRTLPGSTRPAP